MPINLSCPRCQRAMRIEDRYAGLAVKCPGCAAVVTAPAAAPPAPENPFGFGGPAAGPAAGSAFDFDAPAAAGAADEGFRPVTGPDAEGWRNARAGLNLIWFGSGIQVLAVTVVFLAASIIFGTGAAVLSSSRNEETPPVSRQEAKGVSNVLVNVFVLGTFAVGTVMRLVGFIRCVGAPSESGAKELAVGALLCEVLLLAAAGITLAGTFLLWPLLVLGGMGTIAVASLLGLALMLLLLRQIGVALNSKPLRGKVGNFIIWLIAGVVGSGALAAGYFVLVAVVASGQRSSGKGLLVLGGTLLTIAVVVALGLTILVKYLGLFTTASDQIKRRIGK